MGGSPFQLLEYQMVLWVSRFDTLGKLVSAHRAGVHTTPGWCVTPGRCVGAPGTMILKRAEKWSETSKTKQKTWRKRAGSRERVRRERERERGREREGERERVRERARVRENEGK